MTPDAPHFTYTFNVPITYGEHHIADIECGAVIVENLDASDGWDIWCFVGRDIDDQDIDLEKGFKLGDPKAVGMMRWIEAEYQRQKRKHDFKIDDLAVNHFPALREMREAEADELRGFGLRLVGRR